MKDLRLVLLILFLFLFSEPGFSQSSHYTMENAHSHNDYEHALPFYDAYARHFGSIEVDLWAMNDTLFVAHARNQITEGHTFRNLYLEPLIHRLRVNNGYVYKDQESLQLLVDLKSSYRKVLPLLRKVLSPYRKYFDLANNSHAVRIVISGNVPPLDSLTYFDLLFTFDGRLGNHYLKADLQRIKLVSANVQSLVSWKKDDTLSVSDKQLLQQTIDSVHHRNKLIRFWGTPNTNQAYQTLMDLGVDYINVDSLAKFECFIRNKEQD